MKYPLTLFLLLLAAEFSSAQETFTLSRAIDAALEHNHNVLINELESEKANNMATRGNAGLLPSLFMTSGLNGSYSDMELTPGSFFQNLLNPEGGQQGQSPSSINFDGVSTIQFNSSLGAQMVIFDGMKGRLRYKMLETGSDLAGLQHRSEMENTVLTVTSHYMRVASLQNAIELKELALEQSLDRYKIMETRREYGQASEQERLQALVDLKSDSTVYRNLKNQYENAYRDLHTVIGWKQRELIPLDEEIQITESFRYEELLRSLLENNTALHVRLRRIENAEIGQKMARANFLPTLTASAQYGYNYLSATDGQFEIQEQLGFMGGVSVKIPIFNGGRNRTASQNARSSLRQEQLRYEESEQQLRTRFDNTWRQYLHLENQLATEQSNLEVYERNHKRAHDAFEHGLLTGVELRAAQLSLENARLRISEVEFQLIMTQTTLQYLSGKLITQE